jgi:DNA-3-methyladenine glycosylase I
MADDANWYCDVAQHHDLHRAYHDDEYGFPGKGEAQLFELLCLEIFQAGLSWELILKKRQTTFEAFCGFDVDTVAAFADKDIDRLLGNPGIIRNRLKIKSIIHNAHVVQNLRNSHGGFAKWLESHHPLALSEWVKAFKKTFKFTGPEVVNEFLMSIGYLKGAHRESCPVFKQIAKINPPWMQS